MFKSGQGHTAWRLSSPFAAAALLLSCGPLEAAETPVVPEPNLPPSLTVEQPADPISSKPGGPVLLSISARLAPQPGLMTAQIPETIIPEFHFIAPNGNAVLLHRDLVASSANNIRINPTTPINISADAQKQGAVISGRWPCNQGQYHVTMNAYIMDADGNRSNSVRYTVHCNGG